MQNKYVGDIGDYGKLGMLRHLSREGFSVGVNWYLTPDETDNSDGMCIDYLRNGAFSHCDPQLWNALRQIVSSGSRRVSALETSGLLNARFFSRQLDFSNTSKADRRVMRWEWHDLALTHLRGCDVIFVDPDNGLVVPSAEGTPKSNKYVLPLELAECYRAGASVIYYQHKARQPDSFYLEQHNQLIHCGAFPNAVGLGLKFKTNPQRYYFFIAQPRHAAGLAACVRKMVAGDWKEHFEVL